MKIYLLFQDCYNEITFISAHKTLESAEKAEKNQYEQRSSEMEGHCWDLFIEESELME